MAKIASVGVAKLPYRITQTETAGFARELFKDAFKDIDRLLAVFENGEIMKRQLAAPLDWYGEDPTFSEKNDLYIESAVRYSIEAINSCLASVTFLNKPVSYHEIEAIFFISTTGLATPSVEARVMNHLPFSVHTKRIPIWGLGCAGGAAGLARAYDYCLAYPNAKVLVVSVELCSLTFQRRDLSKSNLIGTSIFSDGAACTLVVGENVNASARVIPQILAVQSTLMPDSEDVMGWDIRDEGLHVIFSKDIPTITRTWLGPNVEQFLAKNGLTVADIAHLVAHPGGKKVLDAYQEALKLSSEKVAHAKEILSEYGNMSSATVLYVLEKFMEEQQPVDSYGLMIALGPGFSLELLLLKWAGNQ